MQQYMVVVTEHGKKRRHLLPTRDEATQFIARCNRRKGVSAHFRETVRVTFHAKVDASGQVVRQWNGENFSPRDASVSLFHDGQHNFFGASEQSPEEALSRALSAYHRHQRQAA